MTPYDHWKTTEPETEEELSLRLARTNRQPTRSLPDPHGEWADYVYDPLSRQGFE